MAGLHFDDTRGSSEAEAMMSFRYEVLRTGDKSISKSLNADEIFHRLEDGNTVISGAKDIHAKFGELSSIEQDLLILAAAIYASDRASQRGEREDYPRRISLEVSLHNVDRFYPLIGLLKRALRDLSQDGWDITFKQSKGRPCWGNRDDDECVETKKQGCVLLFSGGLDSLAVLISV